MLLQTKQLFVRTVLIVWYQEVMFEAFYILTEFFTYI